MSGVAEPPPLGLRSTGMRWFVLLVLVLTSVAFLASSAGFALAPQFTIAQIEPLLHTNGPMRHAFAPAMARPVGGALRILLLGVWVAVIMHLVRAFQAERRVIVAHRQAGSRFAPHTTQAHWPFIGALAAGAAWPWAGYAGSRVPELALGTAMMAFALWAALERRRRVALKPTFTGTVEVFAGWATVAVYASFAAVLIDDLGMSEPLAAVVSVLLLMVTAVEVQLRLDKAVAYGFAVIWALIGIAANAIQADLTVATAAIIAIAAITAVLVRVLS